jgi:16S rRNA (guanine527-N7)-methyltransferase
MPRTPPLPDDPRAALAAGLDALGLEATLAAPLSAYLDLLLRWNRTYNLTAVRDPREMVGKHLLDALSLVPHLPTQGRVADLGSGAGLPGIPLALARPMLTVTLVESNGKKARFLREVVRQLGLSHVQVAAARIEAFTPPADAAAGFDVVTARALAPLPELLRLGGHLIAPGGRFLAMKGAWPEPDGGPLPAGYAIEAVTALAVPGLDAERHLVTVCRATGSGAAAAQAG